MESFRNLRICLFLLLTSLTCLLAQPGQPGVCLPGGGCRCGAPLVLPSRTAGADPYYGAGGGGIVTNPVTTPVTTPVVAPGAKQPAAPRVINPLPAPQDVTEPATGLVLPNVGQFDGLGKQLRLVGFGEQKQRAFGMTLTVAATALYMDLSTVPRVWQGKTADALHDNQTFYDWLIDLPVDKAIVMYTTMRISKTAFSRAMEKNLGDRLNGQDVDVRASITQLLQQYTAGERMPARSRIILMWKQPDDLLVSFVKPEEKGLDNQSADSNPMNGQQKLLRAFFASYLDANAVSAALKRNVADTFAAM